MLTREFKAAECLVELLEEKGLRITAAESCTGGSLSAGIISIPGASKVIEGSFVAYSDEIKNKILGVPWRYLKKYTAVSAAVAGSMALGARQRTGADIGLSTTGYLGPTGEKVGQVYIGVSTKQETRVYSFMLGGDREAIRETAVYIAIRLATKEINDKWKK